MLLINVITPLDGLVPSGYCMIGVADMRLYRRGGCGTLFPWKVSWRHIISGLFSNMRIFNSSKLPA